MKSIILIALMVVAVVSCQPDHFASTECDIDRGGRFMGLPPAPDCKHLYNNGNHEAWAECMGVGYK